MDGFFLIINLLVLVTFGADGNLSRKALIKIEKFEQCSDKRNIANIFQDMVVNQIAFNKVKIYGKFLLHQSIGNPATLKAVMHKCASKEEPGTCEYYYTYFTEKFCTMLGQKNMPWSDFVEKSSFPHSCPVKVGNYTIKGADINLENLPSIPLLYGYWKVRSSGKSGGKLWHCAETEFSIGPTEQKRKRGKV